MGTFAQMGPFQPSATMPDWSAARLRPLLQPSMDAADNTAMAPTAAVSVRSSEQSQSPRPFARAVSVGAVPANSVAGLGAAPGAPANPVSWLGTYRSTLNMPAVSAADMTMAPAARPAVTPWNPATRTPMLSPAWLTSGARPATGMQRPEGMLGLGGSHSTHLAGLPARSAGSVSGSKFIADTQGLSRAQREEAIFQQISQGNVPSFERQFKPVTTSFTAADGTRHTATFHVLPDYLAVGSDQDFVRMPMSPLTAQRVADLTGCVLPTRKMVDAVYDQASVKLRPQPQQAGPQMMSNDYYIRHQQMIEQQMAGQLHGELTAGDKKDVVLSNRLIDHPDRVAIYGWHQPNGKAIQPLSTVHENTYADYSHGIRLVAPTMEVDGQTMRTADVLQSPQLSGLLSDEGPLRLTRIPRT